MTTSTLPNMFTFDAASAEAFAERMGETLNHGAVAIMLSIGYRTGVLDVMATLAPAGSAAIAERAGLAERYVREWLAVMVTVGIVRYEPKRRTYWLPPEHAACLTRDAALGNMAVFGQHVAIMGAVQERILECFESGEGMRYGEYPCFHQIMAEDSGQTVTAALFDLILPLVDGIVERLESGIDVLDARFPGPGWRRPGHHVGLGNGTGHVGAGGLCPGRAPRDAA